MLEGYSLALVDQLVTVVAAATVLAYTVYTLTAHDTQALAVTIPFVVFGVFRYLLLLHRRASGRGARERARRATCRSWSCVALWAVDLRGDPRSVS